MDATSSSYLEYKLTLSCDFHASRPHSTPLLFDWAPCSCFPALCDSMQMQVPCLATLSESFEIHTTPPKPSVEVCSAFFVPQHIKYERFSHVCVPLDRTNSPRNSRSLVCDLQYTIWQSYRFPREHLPQMHRNRTWGIWSIAMAIISLSSLPAVTAPSYLVWMAG